MMVLHAVATESCADLFRVRALARVGWWANICGRGGTTGRRGGETGKGSYYLLDGQAVSHARFLRAIYARGMNSTRAVEQCGGQKARAGERRKRRRPRQGEGGAGWGKGAATSWSHTRALRWAVTHSPISARAPPWAREGRCCKTCESRVRAPARFEGVRLENARARRKVRDERSLDELSSQFYIVEL